MEKESLELKIEKEKIKKRRMDILCESIIKFTEKEEESAWIPDFESGELWKKTTMKRRKLLNTISGILRTNVDITVDEICGMLLSRHGEERVIKGLREILFESREDVKRFALQVLERIGTEEAADAIEDACDWETKDEMIIEMHRAIEQILDKLKEE